jgi:hypothetical protein
MASNKYDKLLKNKSKGISRSILRSEDKIARIVDDMLKNPERSNAYWNTARAALKKEYKLIQENYDLWSKVNYPSFYDNVIRTESLRLEKQLANTGSILSPKQLANTDTSKQIKNILYKSAVADVTDGLARGLRGLQRLTRATQQTLIDEFLVDKSVADAITQGNISINKILKRPGTLANQLMEAVDNKRFLTIVDKNGKTIRYKISDYSELVTRTKWHEAQSQASLMTAQNYGTDLVRVSSHNTTSEVCQPFEGKVFSISGDNPDFPKLTVKPPYHVNCLHYLTPVLEGTLKRSGEYDRISAFSKDKTNQPPNVSTFVPVDKRNVIIKKTTADIKASDKYRGSTIKQKRRLLRDGVAQAIGTEARTAA